MSRDAILAPEGEAPSSFPLTDLVAPLHTRDMGQALGGNNTLVVAALVLIAGFSAAGATGCSASDSGEAADDIQRGEPARNYPAVGMVKMTAGGTGTGTLIRPNVVLTAGHVASKRLESFYYGTVPESAPTTSYMNLKHVEIVDSALGECFRAPPSETCAGDVDVALVKLAEPIRGIAPLPLYAGSIDELTRGFSEDPSATAVGFGCHTLSDGSTVSRQRRVATSIFDSLTATEIVVRAGTGIATTGDSGGPLLYSGTIVATVRGGVVKDGRCGRIKEGYARIDLARSWIEKQLRAWGAL